jgi:hypothetical protein
MAEAKLHVVVVCGYGCHLTDSSGADTPLKPYLDRVRRYLHDNQPDLVVFCGGHTQRRSAPGVSEASLMLAYAARKIALAALGRMVAEEDSYTTYENIEKAADAIRRTRNIVKPDTQDPLKITIFCEAQRALLVIMLARHFMRDLVDSIDDITVETASWERADPFRQARNLVYNRLAMSFPLLARRERAQRIKRAKVL